MEKLLNKYRQHFQDNLKTFRLKRGLTQVQLSQLANYDSTYVGKIERGVASPSFETIILLPLWLCSCRIIVFFIFYTLFVTLFLLN